MTANADTFERELLWAWIDNANVGLCVLDAQSQIIMVNRALTAQFLVRAPALMGFDVSALFGAIPADAQFLDFLRKSTSGGTREFVGSHDGAQRFFSVSVSTVPYSRDETYRVLAFADMTELRRTQIELDRIARQWDAVNAGVVISDARAPDMPIVFVNAMFERMSGYSRDEVLGRNCRFLQGRDTDQPGVAEIRKAIAEQRNGYALLRNYHKDGSVFANELFISPMKDASGQVTHFIGVQHERGIRRA